MVTVELAVGFLAVAVMLALLLSVVAAGATRASVCRAVRDGAREASVGASDARDAAVRAFGGPLDVAVARDGRWITVTGSAAVDGPAGWWGGTAHCWATTVLEQAVP